MDEPEYPDFLWPGEDDQDDAAPRRWPALPGPDPARVAAERRRRIMGVTLTAVVGLGLGAGIAVAYGNVRAGSTPPAVASGGAGASQAPGAGQGAVTGLELVGTVTAVGPSSVTIGGGPAQSVRAAVTSSTRFTGAAHALGAVQVGDRVAAQIVIADGVARVISLRDPAT